MKSFRTEIDIQACENKIAYNSKTLFLGSCFATNIGQRFNKSKIPCLVNPYGVIYNPLSVCNTLSKIINNYIFTENDLRFQGDHWHSFYHHSSFNHTNKNAFIANANKNNSEAHQFLKEADYIFITFGTAWVYEFIETNQVVSNCHKYPNKEFNRYILNIEEIVNAYKRLITELLVFNPTINIVFTVSPVRHWKDGAHGNQISKATLLLAIEQIIESFESCKYFPAYELLLDDLRDYRFYDSDMIHPNQTAIEYIWGKFEQTYFSQNTLVYQKEMSKLQKSVHHRPFDVSSPQHQEFLKKLLQKVKEYQKKYPKTRFDYEIDKISSEIL